MIVGVTIVIMVIVTLTLVNAFAKRPFWELMTVPNALLAITPIQNANLVIALPMEHSWSMEYLIVVKVQRHNVLVSATFWGDHSLSENFLASLFVFQE